MAGQNRIRIGVLTRTFGLAGGLRCTTDAETLPTIATPTTAWTGYSESFLTQRRLLQCEPHGGDLVCFFDGVTVKEQADDLLDLALFVDPADLSYDDPLSNPQRIGFQLLDEEGRELGRIAGMIRTPGHYVWQIEIDGREWLLPAAPEFVKEIRDEERKAIVRLIPGMFEEEGDDEQ